MAKTHTSEFDHIVSQSPLAGLWGLLKGFRLRFGIAFGALAIAVCARTGTFFLLGYLVSEITSQVQLMQFLPLLAIGFLALAITEGSFSFVSGTLAAQTAEGIALK